MSGFELGLAVFSAFKEVYLLSRFIYRTVGSAQHSITQRETLQTEFKIEMLWLRSFGRLYLQNNGIMDDSDLNREWLIQVRDILERLRLICGDYAKLAPEEDEEYRKYSPYMNTTTQASRMIEFSWAIEDTQNTAVIIPPGLRNLLSTFRMYPLVQSSSWKWALWERSKLERLIKDFQKWVGFLKPLVPLNSAVHARYNRLSLDALSLAAEHMREDAKRLGLLPHLEMRHESQEEDPEFGEEVLTRNRSLEDRTLEAAPQSTALTLASLVPRSDRRVEKQTIERPESQSLEQSSRTNKLTLASSNSEPADISEAEPVLVEYKTYSLSTEIRRSVDGQEERTPDGVGEVARLANLLFGAGENRLHTLKFRGFMDERAKKRFAFIFEYPEYSDRSPPLSLHNTIDSAKPGDVLALDVRFKIAQTVARALGSFHADNWVHKSVRSHSVIFFRSKARKEKSYTDPYLVEFEYSRPQEAPTSLTGDESVEYNLYRHPERQGATPSIAFQKSHDIYALGVVLLEIGLWKTARELYKEIHGSDPSLTMKASAVKDAYLTASDRLSHCMGVGYTAAVKACLNNDLGAEPGSPTDDPMLFHRNVVQNLDIKRIAG